MKQLMNSLGIPSVWGVVFTDKLDIIDVYPRNFDAIDIRALAEINGVLDEWIRLRNIREIVDADTKLYVSKFGNIVLYVSGDPDVNFSDIWDIASGLKNRYAEKIKKGD
ncbi:MAG: hypothetical protein HY051_05845 [Candidatus Aenigmarchaeota archaeon]|nr:hypothetical protein [Candidatus Aenigmarchaeota archaeon]